MDRKRFLVKEGEKAKRIMPGYTTWINLLDYSAAVLPVTVCDKGVDVVVDWFKEYSEEDGKVNDACEFPFLVWCLGCGKKEGLIEVDDPELYDGAHVAVQVVGRRFQEEKVLAITEILGDALGKHVV